MQGEDSLFGLDSTESNDLSGMRKCNMSDVWLHLNYILSINRAVE